MALLGQRQFFLLLRMPVELFHLGQISFLLPHEILHGLFLLNLGIHHQNLLVKVVLLLLRLLDQVSQFICRLLPIHVRVVGDVDDARHLSLFVLEVV